MKTKSLLLLTFLCALCMQVEGIECAGGCVDPACTAVSSRQSTPNPYRSQEIAEAPTPHRLTDPINRRIPTQIVWHTNYDEAIEVARNEEKPLLVLFTGSDWCTWCIKLEEEALDTDAFSQAASEKFVFVKLDFPSRTRQAREERQRNKKLKRKFHVRGFPTVLLLNPKEEVIAETGYEPGGGRAYARHLMTMLDR